MVNPLIALITDFGNRDHFVGAIKGTILTINPNAIIVDISHEIPKFDIWTAGFILYNAAKFFPKRSIFVAVVDPEVGGKRKIILLKTTDEKFFIAPDNGLLTFVHNNLKVAWIREIRNRKMMLPDISHTFHGRDIMAPVAAHLSLGANPENVGPILKRIKLLNVEDPERIGKTIYGQIWHIDDFGNVITNIPRGFVKFSPHKKLEVTFQTASLKAIFGETFADVAEKENVAYFGSSGLLEIARNRGDLAKELKVKTGQRIIIRW